MELHVEYFSVNVNKNEYMEKEKFSNNGCQAGAKLRSLFQEALRSQASKSWPTSSWSLTSSIDST